MENSNSEKVLWKQLKQGSTIALSSLYDMYSEELYYYGLKITQNDDIVKDSMHDLFLELYKYHAKLADEPNVKFYLLRSLKNTILKNPDYKVRKEQVDGNKNYIHLPVMSAEDEIIEGEIQNENSRKLADALKLLTQKQREGLLLKYVHNKSYEEIAAIMDIKIETSRTIIYRAVKSLKEMVMMIVLLIFRVW